MKKFTKLILGAVFSVGCLFAFAGCNNSDYAAEIQSLKDRIGELEEMIAPPSGDSSGDSSGGSSGSSFTGSPKFNYDSIDEPISYYIQGTKIFDFTIEKFYYQSTTAIAYTVEFQPAFAVEHTTTYPFRATLYDSSKQAVYPSKSNVAGSMYFNVNTGSEATLVLYYINQPFACITMVPTLYNPV